MLWPSPLVSMRRRLSRCAAASLSCLYRHANACLIAPLSSQRLVVASSPLSPRQCLSCRAVASLVAPPPLSLEHLSLRRRLSLSMPRRLSRFAAASIATPTPVSLRLSRASGWLLHRHLSRRASASLVVTSPLSLRRHLSLSMRRRLSRCAAASIATPTPVSLRLSRASGWLLNRHLSRRASASLVVPSLRYLSHCAAVSLGHDPLNPSKKSIGLLGGSSSINPTQRYGTKGLMWGA